VLQAGKSALGALLLCLSCVVSAAQVPGLSLPMLQAQPGDTVLVPIRTHSLTGSSAFELKVRFDQNSLQYLGFRLQSSVLAGTQASSQLNGNLISINTASVSMPPNDTVLLYLRFVSLGLPSYLIWDRYARILPARNWEPIHGAVNPLGGAMVPANNGNQSSCIYGTSHFQLTYRFGAISMVSIVE